MPGALAVLVNLLGPAVGGNTLVVRSRYTNYRSDVHLVCNAQT